MKDSRNLFSHRSGRQASGAILLMFCVALPCIVQAGTDGAKESIQCSFNEPFPEGGGREVQATLEYSQGKLRSLSLFAAISDGEEGGAYICSLDIDHKKAGVVWKHSGSKDLIDNSEEAGNTSRVTVETGKDGAEIFPAELSHDYCGAGMEWPRSIVVPRRGHDCIVGFK
jgi:hypothetical protein